MLEIARVLSKEIPFVRVDLYIISGRVYFGELTFYPMSGFGLFEPEEFDDELGSWLTLPACTRPDRGSVYAETNSSLSRRWFNQYRPAVFHYGKAAGLHICLHALR